MPKWRDLGMGVWRMWRVLDWRPIRREAETPVRLALLGEGPALDRVAALFERAEIARGPVGLPVDDPAPALVILSPGSDRETQATAAEQARSLDERNVASLLLLPPGTADAALDTPYTIVGPGSDAADEHLIVALIEALPLERRLGAARMAPPLRAPLARQLILESSFANAQFALMTNLPAFLPGAGSAAAIGADTLVLTTNQAVLVFKLAAVWGADLSNPRALVAEAAPVVGGAFLWRTAARTLISILPGFAALAPKVGVAYIGTYVVGELASLYYQSGVRPSPERVRQIEADARDALTQVWHRLRPGKGTPAGPVEPGIALPPAADPAALPAPRHAASPPHDTRSMPLPDAPSTTIVAPAPGAATPVAPPTPPSPPVPPAAGGAAS
jgi:uncharacterized protein (DUF697 family)